MASSQRTFQKIDLALSPEEVAARLYPRGDMVFLDSALPRPGAISLLAARPSKIVRGHLHSPESLQSALVQNHLPLAPDWGLPLGGALGWIDFDGHYTFGIFEHFLLYRHDQKQWYGTGDWHGQLGEQPIFTASPAPIDFCAQSSREEFCQIVQRAQDYIAQGDIYQVNLSQAFSAQPKWRPGDSWEFYRRLRHFSPAPYSAYLQLGTREIFSSSPECFLKMSGNHILTRPIKGTRPRGETPHLDTVYAYELRTSPKEISELVMITDLERNDLGKVCQYGSVRANQLLSLEKYPQVFHLVSEVEGSLNPNISHLEALQACFPGGSISGAPKKRAMEIIAELEPTPRGIYTGAIGYMGSNGESQFSIAIRTAHYDGHILSYHVGAGIVADSIPDREYEETLHKARGIQQAATEAIHTKNGNKKTRSKKKERALK